MDGDQKDEFTIPQKRKKSPKPHQYKSRSKSKSNAIQKQKSNAIQKPNAKSYKSRSLSNVNSDEKSNAIIIDGKQIERLPIQRTPNNSKFSINEICVIIHINNPNRREYIGEIARITAYYHKRNVYEIYLYRTEQTWNMAEKNLINYDIYIEQKRKQKRNKNQSKNKKNPFVISDDEKVNDRLVISAGIVCRIVNAVKAPELNGQLCEILEDMTIDSRHRKWRVLLLNNGRDCEFPENILQATTIKPPSRAPIVSRKNVKGSSPSLRENSNGNRNVNMQRNESNMNGRNQQRKNKNEIIKQVEVEDDNGCNCVVL